MKLDVVAFGYREGPMLIALIRSLMRFPRPGVPLIAIDLPTITGFSWEAIVYRCLMLSVAVVNIPLSNRCDILCLVGPLYSSCWFSSASTALDEAIVTHRFVPVMCLILGEGARDVDTRGSRVTQTWYPNPIVDALMTLFWDDLMHRGSLCGNRVFLSQIFESILEKTGWWLFQINLSMSVEDELS